MCPAAQDATFLNTAPELSCLGLLLFLEDATLKNGAPWTRAVESFCCVISGPSRYFSYGQERGDAE